MAGLEDDEKDLRAANRWFAWALSIGIALILVLAAVIAHAQDAAVADGVSTVALDAGQPAPFAGVLYSPDAHADTQTVLGDTARDLDDTADALGEARTEIASLRLVWGGLGLIVGGVLGLVIGGADLADLPVP